MPTVERIPHTDSHVFVGGPLHGQVWSFREVVQLGRQVDDYALYWREVSVGSMTGRRALTWRYLA